jgi:tetratricopeptide (TPR) repeat protein
MNHVFIVTPFGTKNGIDFSRVERELIQPAIKAVGFSGGTTGEIIKQGNIRTDMFQKLLVADLVIADISIHNANAFYELGARHAFREKRTFLIRCSKESLPAEAKLDEVPFDLKTDRYFEYRLNDLAGSLPKLIAALRSTIDSEDRDSPIFQLLPKLEEYEHEVFLPVPLDFRESVELAAAEGRVGDLSLFAEEAGSFEWAISGLCLIGNPLFQMKRFDLSRAVWERVREWNPHDLEANLLLGTIYQRLGDLVRSDQALERALDSPKIENAQRAEAHALRGRNAKQRWQDDWTAAGIPEAQRTAALQSKFLDDAWQEYGKGFEEDQNHYYSGLNALAMLTVLVGLATDLRQIWDERFDDEASSAAELSRLKRKREHLAGAVECSLEAAQQRQEREGGRDPWLQASIADLRCLTSSKPDRVASAYRKAIAELQPFNLDSIRRQLLLYRQLGLLTANVNAALALPNWGESFARVAATNSAAPPHVIVFTGHRIDAPDRTEPRFPADKESVARERIKQKLVERLGQIKGSAPRGLAGGASGGDILFLEVCQELGIPTDLYLALPPDAFCEASVKDAGSQWEKRFYELVASHADFRVLAEEDELPVWLRSRPNYDLWKRNNLWMLHNAVALAGRNITLIALWNRQGGDGPGGTEHMIQEVERLNARTIIIDTKKEFGL